MEYVDVNAPEPKDDGLSDDEDERRRRPARANRVMASRPREFSPAAREEAPVVTSPDAAEDESLSWDVLTNSDPHALEEAANDQSRAARIVSLDARRGVTLGTSTTATPSTSTCDGRRAR